MNRNNLEREWHKLSTPWIREAREGRNPTRTGLLDKPMLEACGNVEGLKILDCGCGEGRFCRILAAKGAEYVFGLDLCKPMRSAVGQWHRTDDGEKQHVILDRYFDEGERRWKMMGVEFTNFHRSLSTYTCGFVKAGFRIDSITEPTVTKEQLASYPELDDELRVPNFIIYILRKPSGNL
ncbi:MAG: methyltransferase domain-containing protein [Candidatus Fermentibacteria bacterium]